MKCPFCNSEQTEVLKTIPYNTVTIRVRICKKCQKPWQTHEIIPNQTVKISDLPLKKVT